MSSTSIVVLLFALAFIFIFISFVLGLLSAAYEVKRQPREPMFLCPVHGPIPQKATIKFSDYEELFEDENGKIQSRIGDFDYCVLCYHKKLSEAEKIQ